MMTSTGPALLAALSAAGAAALLAGPLPARRPVARRRLGSAHRHGWADPGISGPHGRGTARPGPGQAKPGGRGLPRLSGPIRAGLVVAGLAGCLAAAGSGLLSGLPVLVVVASGLAGAALRQRRSRRERAAATARRTAVVALTVGLAAELRAGRTPAAGLSAAAAEARPLAEVLAPALAAASAGADVPAALGIAPAPGAEGLRRVAACWTVAAGTGAGFAAALDRVAEGLRAEDEVRREVQAQLAAPRASALLLAALPGVALLMGAGIGADPVQTLLHTRLGVVCLVAGLTLSGLGVLWTDAMARAAEDAA